jgi:hypothetical protein
MRYLNAILFALLMGSLAQAQQRWTKTYGGVWADCGRFVQQTSSRLTAQATPSGPGPTGTPATRARTRSGRLPTKALS